MNRMDYRAAFDDIPFREDFQGRTIQKLRQSAGQQSEKECYFVKKKRVALVAAMASAMLAVSAFAAAVLLSPKDVAQHVGDETLAQVFESDEAVAINESKSVKGYNVTLMGMVSGEGLSDFADKNPDIVHDRTYAVLSMARADGNSITDDVPELTVSPLVEGYAPWQVNAWSLGGGCSTFAEDGTLYYLFECGNVEPFANHTVYLAVYEGTHCPPSAEIFAFGEDGSISVLPGKEAALFPLPLDSAKADPATALAQFPE